MHLNFFQLAQEYLESMNAAGKLTRYSGEMPRMKYFGKFLKNAEITVQKITPSGRTSATVFITITDAIGRLAGQYQMKENPKFEVNTTYFPGGVYYYSAIMNDKLISSGKFIVAH